MICCKLTYVNQAFQYQKKLIVFTVYSFQIKSDSCLTFKSEQNDGTTEVVKDETIITLKNGDKGQKLFTKNV